MVKTLFLNPKDEMVLRGERWAKEGGATTNEQKMGRVKGE